MSDYPLAPKDYRIENTWWKGQYVSVGNDAIVGYKYLLGGTQIWKLEYKDGYATFQGVPPYVADGKYIAVDWARRVLVYSEEPGLFQLESIGSADKNVFVVKPVLEDVENAEGALIGWQLQTGADGSPVGLDINLMLEIRTKISVGNPVRYCVVYFTSLAKITFNSKYI